MSTPLHHLRAFVLVATCIAAATNVFAQRTEFRVGAINKTPIGTNEMYMTFGADADATIGLDTALGEREIPAIPLPGDIYYMWTVVQQGGDEVWLNPKDLRPLRTGTYIDTVDLRVQWTGGSLEFVSPGMKPTYIDSAYIVDAVLDFPNNVYKYKLWSGQTAPTNNPAINKFRLLAWYNASGSSVQDEPSTLVIGPVPFTNELNVRSEGAGQELRLIDMQGRTVHTSHAYDGIVVVSTSHLPAGPYIVELTQADGSIRRRMIVRQ